MKRLEAEGIKLDAPVARATLAPNEKIGLQSRIPGRPHRDRPAAAVGPEVNSEQVHEIPDQIARILPVSLSGQARRRSLGSFQPWPPARRPTASPTCRVMASRDGGTQSVDPAKSTRRTGSESGGRCRKAHSEPDRGSAGRAHSYQPWAPAAAAGTNAAWDVRPARAIDTQTRVPGRPRFLAFTTSRRFRLFRPPGPWVRLG